MSYNVLVNGKPGNIITSTKGLRQRSSIPYLFLLCVEGLSALIYYFKAEKLIQGLVITREGVRLNHLPFTDDCLLFCRANVQEWSNLKILLEIYKMAFGHTLNMQKSCIFISSNKERSAKPSAGNFKG